MEEMRDTVIKEDHNGVPLSDPGSSINDDSTKEQTVLCDPGSSISAIDHSTKERTALSDDPGRPDMPNDRRNDPITNGAGFIDSLRRMRSLYADAKIVFHSDMDGFASALIAKHLLERLGYNVVITKIVPAAHINITNVDMEEDLLYFFVDIRPPRTGDNVFCVDHHMTNDTAGVLSGNYFLFSEQIDEEMIPPTATSLVAYLDHIQKGFSRDYQSFIRYGSGYISHSIWYLIIQATIADHLWLLSEDVGSNQLKKYTVSEDVDVDLCIKLSIAISLLLGRKKDEKDEKEKKTDPMDVFYDFFREPLKNLDETYFLDRLKDRLQHVDAIFGFVDRINRTYGKFRDEIAQEMEREMGTLEIEIRTGEERLVGYQQAVDQIEKEGDAPSGEDEKGFYGAEIEKIRNRLSQDNNRLQKLKEIRDQIHLKPLEKLALFIPLQKNEQTRGILSSLFYYKGWKNTIIEVDEHKSTWSSRGFNREELKALLEIVSIDSREFTEYKLADSARKKYPGFVNKPDVVITTGYSGGMGGRGKIFGGIITGHAVPTMEANEDGGIEIGKGLKDLPDRRFWSPATQAIKSRFFKDDDWLTIQIGGGTVSCSILDNDVDMLIVHQLGITRTYRIPGNSDEL